MSILIVEDNATNGMILKHLARNVYSGDIVLDESPVVALARCQKQDFELVIVDQVMPGMTGAQFTRSIRMLPHMRAVPVIMVTAEHSEEVRALAVEAGVTDFLTKPVEAIAFRRLISTLRYPGENRTFVA